MQGKPRRKTRIKSRFLVLFPKGGEYLEAHATNLSESGMFVETPYPPPEGVEMEFFSNYDVLTKGVIRGRVVRHDNKGGRVRGMGVTFLETKKSYIYDLIFKQNAFNRKYMGLPCGGMYSPRMLLYRARKSFGL